MSNIIAFFILFGILVFVHELGHFLSAKFFKIGVERFALGFGPKLFGKKIGETEYLIAALPLGGYVKMVGDEPVDEQQADQSRTKLAPNSFLAKPAWQRIVVAFMGPIANFVLPILLFFVVFMIGQPNLATEIGYISAGSPAQSAGMLPGDKIIAVDGQPVKEWGALTDIIAKSAERQVALKVVRENKEIDLTVTPRLEDGMNPFMETIKVGRIGIVPQSFLLNLYIPDTNSAAYKAGLRTDDKLTAVNNRDVRFAWQIRETINSSTDKNVLLTVSRQDKNVELTLPKNLLVDSSLQHPLALHSAGIFLKEMVVDQVMPKSIAEEKGLKSGDILFTLNDKPILEWFAFQEQIRSNSGEPMKLTVIRDAKPLLLDISPRLEEQKEELTGEKFKQRMLGISSKGEVGQENIFMERISNPIKALGLSISRSYEIGKLTVIGFGKLIAGQLSAKSLGGPILIYQLAGKSWKRGLYDFIGMIVGISISLGILNLLPIPVLDGGHIMFYTFEILKGSPIRYRTRIRAQQIGMALLLALMVFAFYNDLGRISWNEISWVNWLRQMFS